ncbi:hypothetical protein PE066_19715 [Ramlibacter tataouinensis]|uniref:energy transducer TonB n=1 Tax=Ramlibacter tataouinensis TaxID=94132 RepID=UPI0022F3DEB8|nr:hypothetical protein [Ramlibacter tataouinensis]WBY01654.1 hypothetical protein PE066_19715 [Ramlibacter tataouinensis]
MRFTRHLALAAAALLAACAAPGPGPLPASVGTRGAQPATVAGAQVPRTHSGPARSWGEYKLRVAQRIMATSSGETFGGELPDPLRSIPVLQIHLNRDGSIRNIAVLRVPGQSPQTLDMAIRAIRRAAPFEPVGHLPQPWQFSETFLYNDDLKFQLRTLVEAQ